MNLSGPWSLSQVERWLGETVVPARIACNGEAGWPGSASLWYLYEGGSFYCATPRTAALSKWLEADSRCTIEIAPETPPYCGVRARGHASVSDDVDCALLRRVILRYFGTARSEFARWLLERPISEAAIRIEPVRMTSWDFRDRMTPEALRDSQAGEEAESV